jgi:hypothetical protein
MSCEERERLTQIYLDANDNNRRVSDSIKNIHGPEWLETTSATPQACEAALAALKLHIHEDANLFYASDFDSATSWSVDYYGVPYDDARKIDGVWWYRSFLGYRKILRFPLQDQVVPLFENPQFPEEPRFWGTNGADARANADFSPRATNTSTLVVRDSRCTQRRAGNLGKPPGIDLASIQLLSLRTNTLPAFWTR